jgi:DNA polymerase III subunit alpha
LLQSGNIVKVTGKVSVKENEVSKILVNDIEKISKQDKIYIRINENDIENDIITNIEKISDEYYGDVPVYLFYNKDKKLKLLNRKFWLDNSVQVIEELQKLFGSDNVTKKS